jgi:hypothetical protein
MNWKWNETKLIVKYVDEHSNEWIPWLGICDITSLSIDKFHEDQTWVYLDIVDEIHVFMFLFLNDIILSCSLFES